MGFHLMIPPRPVARLLGFHRPKRTQKEPAIAVPLAPYGGLFFHKSVLAKLGYPNERFFLYNDDTEYTYRFTSAGGKLFLIPGSILSDLDTSWHVIRKGETFVSHFLLADSDWRIYYSTRNQSYVSRHLWCRSFGLYSLNKWAFFLLLSLYALRHGKWRRLVLIARASRHGELGELGRRRDLEIENIGEALQKRPDPQYLASERIK
jgi:GT2 family glycosyltransferase